jgi:hypothetical protein
MALIRAQPIICPSYQDPQLFFLNVQVKVATFKQFAPVQKAVKLPTAQFSVVFTPGRFSPPTTDRAGVFKLQEAGSPAPAFVLRRHRIDNRSKQRGPQQSAYTVDPGR